jgi:hypothetical protein
MNNKWLMYLVAIAAVLIAGSAAYFSVTGLGVLFSGAAIAVMVMAGSLEFAKLVTATYLKQNWETIKGFNKWYLATSVAILMLITSAGIFGYLSNAFQQQSLILDQVQRQIDVWDVKIKSNNDQIASLTKQLDGLQSNQGTILEKGKVNSRLLRSIDNRDKQVSKLQDKVAKLQDLNVAQNDSINKIKTDNVSIEKEVGGFRFVAEAFGVDLKVVVKFFIFLIVIVFDPLAIALIIAFNQLVMDTKKEDEEEEKEEEEKVVVDAKDIVSEVSRLRLSEEELSKLEEYLLRPKPPVEEKLNREKILSEMIKNDEELGLYEEPFENPMVKEEDMKWDGISQEVWDRMEAIEKQRESIHGPITEEDLPPTGAYANSGIRERLEQERDEEPYAGPTPTNEPEIIEETQEEDISDWDVTLMDGLEDEELFFHEEPTIKEEEQNFSTIEPISENIFQEEEQFNIQVDESIDNEPELMFSDEFLEEAIAEFNRNSFEEELDEMDGEPVYQSETKEVDQINEIVDNVINEDEPIFEKIIDRTNITNQDGLFFSQNVTENVQETSSETNDEKKN